MTKYHTSRFRVCFLCVETLSYMCAVRCFFGCVDCSFLFHNKPEQTAHETAHSTPPIKGYIVCLVAELGAGFSHSASNA